MKLFTGLLVVVILLGMTIYVLPEYPEGEKTTTTIQDPIPPAYGQIAELTPLPKTPTTASVQSQASVTSTTTPTNVQCVDFNQDKVCEFVVLANGTMIANPMLSSLQPTNPLYKFYIENQIKKTTVEKDNDYNDNDKDDNDKKKKGNDGGGGNPYCDLVPDDYDGGCWDRKDYHQGGKYDGLYPCKEGPKKDWKDCKVGDGEKIDGGEDYPKIKAPVSNQEPECYEDIDGSIGPQVPCADIEGGDDGGDGCQEQDDYCNPDEDCDSPQVDCIDDVNVGDDGDYDVADEDQSGDYESEDSGSDEEENGGSEDSDDEGSEDSDEGSDTTNEGSDEDDGDGGNGDSVPLG